VSIVLCEGGCGQFIDTDLENFCDKCECDPITGQNAEVAEAPALTDHQKAWLDGMRAMCDFLEANPKYIQGDDGQTINVHARDKAGLARAAKDLAPCEKYVGLSGYYSVVKKFGPHKLDAFALRDQVCERIQTGVKTVTERVIPEGVQLVEVTKEVPVYEYKCPKSLLEVTAS
jgi:hypothetical protein